jgi:hypothetical protein
MDASSSSGGLLSRADASRVRLRFSSRQLAVGRTGVFAGLMVYSSWIRQLTVAAR